jgi:hypothetical protein
LELDSLPVSEARARPRPTPGPVSPPSWKSCYAHGVLYLFECGLCAGAMLGYGH